MKLRSITHYPLPITHPLPALPNNVKFNTNIPADCLINSDRSTSCVSIPTDNRSRFKST
ncbi:hypothetical protein [Chamaesiphon polymorphus]|uniref:hypothetical protein n=1 Tax=Chamaesiphon polymorphus TaxID=2107691 RepID=UPI0015E69B26|nr:hypothetical protein [Chamaesiphon polymorphus]